MTLKERQKTTAGQGSSDMKTSQVCAARWRATSTPISAFSYPAQVTHRNLTTEPLQYYVDLLVLPHSLYQS